RGVAPALVTPEAELLERQGGHREEDPEEDGDDEEAGHEPRGDASRGVRIERHREARKLQDGPEQLEQKEVRECDQPEGAEAGAAEDAAMAPQSLRESALPAPPLARKGAEVLRRLCPADWIGHELDSVVLTTLSDRK